ncbi:MAG: CotH kinase family protein [Bacteroidales bacterium]
MNGEHNDPSIMRSKVMWDIFFGIPAPRVNHVEVYINGNYYGLYINVEHIDEEFVHSRFGNNDGNLYKCLYPPTSITVVPIRIITNTFQVTECAELKINEEVDDYSDLAELIGVLTNTQDNQLVCDLTGS